MQVTITRKIEFDAGHRIPDHKSKCKNFHGHRYVLEASIIGPVIDNPGASDNGMVVDFGNLKQLMMECIGEPWDHAFLVWENDSDAIVALSALQKDHKTVVLDKVPTVENLAIKVFQILGLKISELTNDFKLDHIRLFETPNCYSDVFASTSL